MKQYLKKLMPGVIFCFAMASCSLKELGTVQKDDYNGVWTGPSISPPAISKSVTYISAFNYPQDYDWMSDPERGAVKCSLVVFRDGLPILKVPVGDEYRVGPDPDMHRIIDGHLYTDYSTESMTIIKRDGKPLIEYSEPEMMCDFKVLGGNVHTLGHSRLGQGFSYRINGRVILERDSGRSFERLFVQDSTVSLAFTEQIKSADGILERYYVMVGGKVAQVALRDDVKKVWDIVVHGVDVLYLASVTGVSSPVMVSGTQMTALSIPSSMSLVSCKINMLDKGFCVEGVLSNCKRLQCALWDMNGKYSLFPQGLTFSAFCSDEHALHCTLNPASETGAGLIYRSGETLDMPLGYSCLGRSAMDFSSGMLSVGLSSTLGGKPLLWTDGQTKELDVNGYISCVASETH